MSLLSLLLVSICLFRLKVGFIGVIVYFMLLASEVDNHVFSLIWEDLTKEQLLLLQVCLEEMEKWGFYQRVFVRLWFS